MTIFGRVSSVRDPHGGGLNPNSSANLIIPIMNPPIMDQNAAYIDQKKTFFDRTIEHKYNAMKLAYRFV